MTPAIVLRQHVMTFISVLAASMCLAAASPCSLAQETTAAHAIVTVTSKGNEGQSPVPQQAVTATLNGKQAPVSGWVPERGDHSNLQLVLFLDDSARMSLGLHLNEMATFLNSLPPATEVAVAYMEHGSAVFAQDFTPDHAAAVKALHLPGGIPGSSASPYFCLSSLVKHWPASDPGVRHEVVMVTNGVDPYEGRGFNPDDPYVQAAMSDAQKAGVVVYAIYFADEGRFNRGFAVYGGQNYLLELTSATGGTSYYQGTGNPVSFQPFLTDIQHKLDNQYELTLTAQPKKGLQSLKVKTTKPDTKLQFPSAVPTSAQQAGSETPSSQ